MRASIGGLLVTAALLAQDRLPSMPGYKQHLKMARQIPTAIKSGAVSAAWTANGQAVEYARDGRRFRFDLASRQTVDLGADELQSERGQSRAGQPERGRQFESAVSPDGKHKAFYRDRNLWLGDADGANERA